MWFGAMLAAAVALVFSVGLPVAAKRAQTKIPYGAVSNENFAFIPQPGWEVPVSQGDTQDTVTMVKEGAIFSVRTAPVDDSTTAQEALDDVSSAKPNFVASTNTRTFISRSKDSGAYVVSTDGTHTGVMGVVVVPKQHIAAHAIGISPSTSSRQLLNEMAQMINSIGMVHPKYATSTPKRDLPTPVTPAPKQ